MRTICYVILNYKTYEEAAACAESILSTQTWKNMHIVIVDNGSGNGSEEWLLTKIWLFKQNVAVCSDDQIRIIVLSRIADA